MKKFIAILAFVSTMALGTSVFAAGVADCAHMDKGKCAAMCAKKMNRGISDCVTSQDCPMENGCQ